MPAYINIKYEVYDDSCETSYEVEMGDMPGLTEITAIYKGGDKPTKEGSLGVNTATLEKLIVVLQKRLEDAQREVNEVQL